jgi:hypothetical protein
MASHSPHHRRHHLHRLDLASEQVWVSASGTRLAPVLVLAWEPLLVPASEMPWVQVLALASALQLAQALALQLAQALERASAQVLVP